MKSEKKYANCRDERRKSYCVLKIRMGLIVIILKNIIVASSNKVLALKLYFYFQNETKSSALKTFYLKLDFPVDFCTKI